MPGDAMTEWGSLHIEVVDGEIVVSAPFTSYTVTYYKLAKSPQLLAKRIASRDDPGSAMTLSGSWRARGRPPTTRRASWGGLCSVSVNGGYIWQKT